MNLSKNVNIVRVANSASTAQTDVNSSILDMSGYDGVIFIASMGAITGGGACTLEAQQNTANSTSGMAQLSGSVATGDDTDNISLVVDVYRPLKRYVRAVLKRADENSVADGIIAIQYKGRKAPVTFGATVKDSKIVVSPAEAS